MFNILSPQSCYIDFPNWPNELPHPRRPRANDHWVPTVPPSYPSGEKPYDFQELFKKLRNEPEYFSKTEAKSLKFRLEMAGFAKEDVSVSVKIEDYTLKVESINKQKPFSRNFIIPNAGSYSLLSGAAQMSNGLLEIFFAPKKEEIKTIKIL